VIVPAEPFPRTRVAVIVRRLILAAASLFLLTFTASAQDSNPKSSLVEVAQKLAPAISKTHQSSVVIVPFMKERPVDTELGRGLADELSAAFTDAHYKVTVVDRSAVNRFLEQNAVPPVTLGSFEAARWASKAVGAKSFVRSVLAVSGDTLDVEIDAYRTDNGKRIEGYKLTTPMTPRLQQKLANEYPWQAVISRRTVHAPDEKNYTSPECIYCPSAEFPITAATKKTQGTVMISVVVGDEGRAHDFVLIQEQPDGLTEKAVEAVQTWRFKPAKGPDGRSASVRQTIEVQFHLQ
jgi:TonB family protein